MAKKTFLHYCPCFTANNKSCSQEITGYSKTHLDEDLMGRNVPPRATSTTLPKTKTDRQLRPSPAAAQLSTATSQWLSVCFSGPMHKHPVTYCMSHDLVFWLEARAFHKKKSSVCGSCDPVGISLHGEEPADLTCLGSFHCQLLRCHNCCSFHCGPVSGNTAEFEAVPLNYLLIFQECYTFFRLLRSSEKYIKY